MISGFLFILGLCIGSFLNVLIDRLADDRTLFGRSMCDWCNKVLEPLNLIPVVSWFIQKGKSACCGKALSAQYPVVELITGGLFVISGYYGGLYDLLIRGDAVRILQFAALLTMISTLIVIVVADIKYHIIPDIMSLLCAISGLVYLWPVDLSERMIGAILLTGLMFLPHVLTGGRGMGLGDVKFAAVIGLLLGFVDGFIALYLGFLGGGIFGLAIIVGRKFTWKSAIAFGPFLVLGMVVMLFARDEVWEIVRLLF